MTVDIFWPQVKSQFKRETLLGLEKLEAHSKIIIPSHQMDTLSYGFLFGIDAQFYFFHREIERLLFDV